MSDTENNTEKTFPVIVNGTFHSKALSKIILPANDTDLALQVIRAEGTPVSVESRDRILNAIQFQNFYDEEKHDKSNEPEVNANFRTYVTVDELSKIMRTDFADVAFKAIRQPQSEATPSVHPSISFKQAADIMTRREEPAPAATEPAPITAEAETPAPEAEPETAPAAIPPLERASASDRLLEDNEAGPASAEPEPETETEAAPHAGTNGAMDPSAAAASVSVAASATTKRTRRSKEILYPASYEFGLGDKTVKLLGQHILALHVMVENADLKKRTDIMAQAKLAGIKFVGYRRGMDAHVIPTTFVPMIEEGVLTKLSRSNVKIGSRRLAREILSGARHHAEDIVAATANLNAPAPG